MEKHSWSRHETRRSQCILKIQEKRRNKQYD